MKTTGAATSRAKPISCLNTTIVTLFCANCFITTRTSSTTSESKAKIGSTNNITIGFVALAHSYLKIDPLQDIQTPQGPSPTS